MLQRFESDTGVVLKDALRGVKTRSEATKKSQALMTKFAKWFERVVWPHPEFAEAHRALTEGSDEAVATPGLMEAARDCAEAEAIHGDKGSANKGGLP